MFCEIAVLILTISAEMNVPPYFSLSVAITESNLRNISSAQVRPPNRDGSVDRGIFQLNSHVYPNIKWDCIETNIRLGIRHLRTLLDRRDHHTYWEIAISYNAGHAWVVRGTRPPQSSIDYADRVMLLWQDLSPRTVEAVIRRGE
jgi:hypothetical protein